MKADAPPGRPEDRPQAQHHSVSEGYFETMGARLIDGRFFTAYDTPTTEAVVVINETMARQYWPGEDPLGKRLTLQFGDTEKRWLTVVGVAADAADAMELSARHYPTVAILDVKLAGAIDGATLADHLDVNYGIEIVFVTGNPLYVCRHTGSRRYQVLAKPFSDEELLKAVTTACATAHAREVAAHQATSA